MTHIGPSILEMREAIRCLTLGEENEVAKHTLDYCGASVPLALTLLKGWCEGEHKAIRLGFAIDQAFSEVFGLPLKDREPEHICWDCKKPCFEVTDIGNYLVGECCAHAYTHS
jgi:hypothetical protein